MKERVREKEREGEGGRRREGKTVREKDTHREKLSSEGESEGGRERERRGGERCITSTVHVDLFTCPCTDTPHCPNRRVR